MEILTLRQNMRLQHSPDEINFATWLLDIGHSRNMDGKGNVEIPQLMVIYDEEILISIVYGDISRTHTPPPPDYFLEHAILAPKNTDVQETNQRILDRLPGPEIVLHSADSVETDNPSRDAYGHDDIPHQENAF